MISTIKSISEQINGIMYIVESHIDENDIEHIVFYSIVGTITEEELQSSLSAHAIMVQGMIDKEVACNALLEELLNGE